MKKAVKLIPIAAIGTFFLGVIVIFAVFASSWSQRSKPDFMGYETTVPLAGALVAKTNVLRGGTAFGGKTYEPKYEQTYGSDVVLIQEKYTGSSSPAACKDPQNHGDFTYECQSGDIKDGGAYAIAKVYRNGELYDISVHARIGDTRMRMTVPEETEAQLAEYIEWQNYFNSMHPSISLQDKLP